MVISFTVSLEFLRRSFNGECKLVFHFFHSFDHWFQIGFITEIFTDFIQRKPQILKHADASDLCKGVNCVVSVGGPPVFLVGLNQSLGFVI